MSTFEIWLLSLLVLGIAYHVWGQKRNVDLINDMDRAYYTKLEEARESNFKRGFAQGVDSERAKSWQFIVASYDKEANATEIFLNGRMTKSAFFNNKTVGFWYLNGHIRDGFSSDVVFNEERAMNMYARDAHKILEATTHGMKKGPF